jgi:hypothetical protein
MTNTAAFHATIFSFFLSMFLVVPTANPQAFEPAQYHHEHVAGVWQWGYLNGPAKGSMLDFAAIAIDASGNIYTSGDGRVRVIDAKTGRVWNLAGNGVRGYKDGPAQSAMFNPGGQGYLYEGIAVDSIGNVYIADGMNSLIRRVYQTGSQWYVTTYAGKGSVTLTPGQTGTIATVKFGYVPCVTVDSSDNVWTRDYKGLYKITPAGTVYCYKDNYGPYWMMQADGNRNVYAMTRAQFYKIAPDGTETLVAGMPTPFPTPTPIDGPALQSTFFAIFNLAVSPDGVLYGGNGDENRLRRVKNGYTMTLHTDGWHIDATSRELGWLLGGPMAVDPNGVIYVWANNPSAQLMLRKIVPR